MRMRSIRWLGLLPFLGALALAGCSSKLSNNLLPNIPPTVRLTNAPYDSVGRYYYAVTINWTGYDPDGRISYYLYATDPPHQANQDTAWIRTTQSEQTILFPATHTVGQPPGINSEDPHTFVLKAVDNRGATSPVVERAFFSTTIAPTVRITNPQPKLNDLTYVTPAVLVTWDGSDVDGVLTKRPVKYKWKLLSDQSEVTEAAAFVDRDSVRRYYVARNWAGWDSTSAETTVVQLRGLTPEKEYIFCVIGFDEAGAYSPRFELDGNMLRFRVTFAGNNNPQISFFNQYFFYQYSGGSYEPLNPARVVPLQVPANQPITFNWFATAIPGSSMRSYRWAVDILDLTDDTPRTDQQTDLAHWSPKNLDVTSATIGPYPGSPTQHKFYLEAEDINGLKSLGIIGFTAVQPSFSKELGVFLDARAEVDQYSLKTQPCPNAINSRWPSYTEIDTFLFARGGVPWKCMPAGTISSPGVFSGYTFDTLGTRTGRIDQTMDLATLGTYRHVLWIADRYSISNVADGNRPSPIGALRYMSFPNRLNTLAVYSTQGGQIWLAGGACLFATMPTLNQGANPPLDKANNNTTGNFPGPTLEASNGELIPGRFPYDLAKWQSSIKYKICQPILFSRGFGRNANNPFYVNSHLPQQLHLKDPAVDVFPPNRTGQSQGNFYFTDTNVEYMNNDVPNNYMEDLDPGPNEDFRSMLDTVFVGTSGQMVTPPSPPDPLAMGPNPPVNVLMTIYPARDINPRASVITSGFNLWDWTRADCVAMVDFVLQDVWGIHKGPVPMSPARASNAVAVPGAPPVWSPPGSASRAAPVPSSITSIRGARGAPASARKQP